MREYFHPTPEIKEAIKRIRDFCESPALNGGGMMLVTGPRGVGKTRLVDEALNDRREFVPWKERRGPLDEESGQGQVAPQDEPGSAMSLDRPEGRPASSEPSTRNIDRGRIEPSQRPDGFFHWLWRRLVGRIAWLLAIGGGRDPCRDRLRIKRRPRGVARILLAVPVDPFFPDNGPAKDEKGQPVHGDLDGDTLALLRNLVFALTSAIDPRAGVRRHGRTLKARLGPLTYWFTRTALIRPQGHPGRLSLALCLSASFLAGVLFHFWARDPTLAPLMGWTAIKANILPVAFAFPVALAAAWLWLRHLDLARIRRISAHLYDLIHAQQYSMESQSKIERTWRWEAKGRQLRRVLGMLALLGVGVLAYPQALDWLKTRFEGWQGAPAELAAGLWAVALFMGGLLLITYSGSRDTRRHASFGAGNRVWLIALLRRYLFLLHRAGIEPVLVVDEIDKLGAIDHEAAATHPAGTATAPPGDPANPQSPGPRTQLDRFTDTLVRLKQSLGAEFIWILIDSDALYDRVIRDRSRPEQGPLATLIQCDVALNPISFSDYEGYCTEFYERTASGTGRGRGHCPTSPLRTHARLQPAPNPAIPDDPHARLRPAPSTAMPDKAVLAAWWLESRGVFFGLSARTRESSYGSTQVGATVDRLALLLATVLDYLKDKNWHEFTFCVCHDSREESPERQEFAERIARSPWHRRYLEMGLMDGAARLFDPTRRKPTYAELRPADADEPVSDPDTPRSLKRIGELGLIEFLQRLYVHGDDYPDLTQQLRVIGITGGPIGIPAHPPGGNQDAQMRVQIPRSTR